MLAACVSAHRTLPDGTVERVPRAEMHAHAEAVFRRHNAVSNAYLLHMPELEAGDTTALEAAEAAMDAACAPVDALAIAYRDGQKMGFDAKLRLARALDACDAATSAAESALRARLDAAAGSL
jgi:hypothetical protein